MREGEEMWRYSLSTFLHFLFISSLSIHFLYKKLSHFSQNVKYDTFVMNVTKTLNVRAMRKKSGSNSLRESSASCAGLIIIMLIMDPSSLSLHNKNM